MADFPTSGANARLAYGWETTFGSVSGSINKAFSQGVKLSTFEIDNSVDYVYGLGSQDAQKSVAKEFKGSWGVEFALSDPWWLRSILGAAPTDAGATPYTHTWDSSQGISNTLTSMSLDLSFDLDTDSHQILLGCITNTMTVTCSVGEIVRCRLEGMFANMTKDTNIIALVNPVEEPFSFAAGSFELPNSTTIADVQSLEMTFNRNVDFIWGLGSRFAQKNVPKQREWNIKLTATYENDTQFWDSLLGSSAAPTASPAEVATATVTITNGLTSSNMRKYVFTFANVRVERGSITPVETENVIKQDITLRARTLTSVVVSNNTAIAL
jgi:hypothetical protein